MFSWKDKKIKKARKKRRHETVTQTFCKLGEETGCVDDDEIDCVDDEEEEEEEEEENNEDPCRHARERSTCCSHLIIESANGYET